VLLGVLFKILKNIIFFIIFDYKIYYLEIGKYSINYFSGYGGGGGGCGGGGGGGG